jgi:hypothetical protein
MANERYEFTALQTIAYQGAPAYVAGQGVMAQVVEDLGLVVGVDVTPARAGVVARPAGNAKRSEWAAYALAEGMDQTEVDDLTRDQLRARFPDGQNTEPGDEPDGEE